jgi:hypothetical protein
MSLQSWGVGTEPPCPTLLVGNSLQLCPKVEPLPCWMEHCLYQKSPHGDPNIVSKGPPVHPVALVIGACSVLLTGHLPNALASDQVGRARPDYLASPLPAALYFWRFLFCFILVFGDTGV